MRSGKQHSARWLQAASLTLAVLCSGVADAQTDVPVVSDDQRLRAPVTSFLEMRERNLVRQAWDASCGAAALSTVLTHHFGTPYSEATIAVSILSNTDPQRVRERGGFSLLDLKRFAEAVGYVATGYGQLTVDDLAGHVGPVIVPVVIRGLDHFVVFRGRVAGRVLIGDPAFGNLVLPEAHFRRYWTSGIGFFVEPAGEQTDGRSEPLGSEAMHLTVPDLNYIYRLGSVPARLPGGRR